MSMGYNMHGSEEKYITRFGQGNLKRSLARLGNGWDDKIKMDPTGVRIKGAE